MAETGGVAEATSQKPYLLRALYEWCVDNGFTPYLTVVVDATTRVPVEYVRNGEIVLNVGPLAANRLKMGNETIEFAARFGGVARELMVPIAAVSAIYARETGQGMSFEIEAKGTASAAGERPVRVPIDVPRAPDIAAPPPVREVPPDDDRPGGGAPTPISGKRPSLRRVK